MTIDKTEIQRPQEETALIQKIPGPFLTFIIQCRDFNELLQIISNLNDKDIIYAPRPLQGWVAGILPSSEDLETIRLLSEEANWQIYIGAGEENQEGFIYFHPDVDIDFISPHIIAAARACQTNLPPGQIYTLSSENCQKGHSVKNGRITSQKAIEHFNTNLGFIKQRYRPLSADFSRIQQISLSAESYLLSVDIDDSTSLSLHPHLLEKAAVQMSKIWERIRESISDSAFQAINIIGDSIEIFVPRQSLAAIREAIQDYIYHNPDPLPFKTTAVPVDRVHLYTQDGRLLYIPTNMSNPLQQTARLQSLHKRKREEGLWNLVHIAIPKDLSTSQYAFA